MKYHLGCGKTYLDDHVNVNFPIGNYVVNRDVKADIYDNILTMKMERCSEIINNHVFEHFNYVDSFYLLYKWYFALVSNGILKIKLPDIEQLAVALENASVEKSFRITRYLYGSHEDAWTSHLNGWTASTLIYVLKKIGFIIYNTVKTGDINSEYPNCNIEIKAIKEGDRRRKDVVKTIHQLFKLYKNGDAEFENNLETYYIKEFDKRIELFG